MWTEPSRRDRVWVFGVVSSPGVGQRQMGLTRKADRYGTLTGSRKGEYLKKMEQKKLKELRDDIEDEQYLFDGVKLTEAEYGELSLLLIGSHRRGAVVAVVCSLVLELVKRCYYCCIVAATVKRNARFKRWLICLDVQSKVSAVVLGKEKPVEESNPEYEKLKHYIFELEDHLAEAQKHAYRLVKRHRELGQSLSDFGKAVKLLGTCEGDALGKVFSELGVKSEILSIKLQKECSLESVSMPEVLNGKIMIISSGQLDAITRARPILSAMSEKLYVFEGALGAGSGRLGIVDHDVVQLNNLHRQIIHTEAYIGQSKVESAAAACHSYVTLD
ncbi:unnamed protein product [Camellia sinensis]